MKANFEALESQLSEAEMALLMMIAPIYVCLGSAEGQAVRSILHNGLESHALNFTVQGKHKAANMMAAMQEITARSIDQDNYR